MLKNLSNNNRGIVFVTVLMIIIIMTLLSINILSVNISQALIQEQEVTRIESEMLAMGALGYRLSKGTDSSYTETFDNNTFNVSTTTDATASGVSPFLPKLHVQVYLQ